jgi:hypothetical protein
MLSLYPVYMHHRYRGYPDVLLIDFSECESAAEEYAAVDVRGMLAVMEEIIAKQSDAASSGCSTRKAGDGDREGHDEYNTLMVQIRNMAAVDYEGPVDAQMLRSSLTGIAQDMRHIGPETIPKDVIRLLHADLATATELEHGMRDPTARKLRSEKEVTNAVAEDGPVVVGGLENGETK